MSKTKDPIIVKMQQTFAVIALGSWFGKFRRITDFTDAPNAKQPTYPIAAATNTVRETIIIKVSKKKFLGLSDSEYKFNID